MPVDVFLNKLAVNETWRLQCKSVWWKGSRVPKAHELLVSQHRYQSNAIAKEWRKACGVTLYLSAPFLIYCSRIYSTPRLVSLFPCWFKNSPVSSCCFTKKGRPLSKYRAIAHCACSPMGTTRSLLPFPKIRAYLFVYSQCLNPDLPTQIHAIPNCTTIQKLLYPATAPAPHQTKSHLKIALYAISLMTEGRCFSFLGAWQ